MVDRYHPDSENLDLITAVAAALGGVKILRQSTRSTLGESRPTLSSLLAFIVNAVIYFSQQIISHSYM